jgi:hypothetical protein
LNKAGEKMGRRRTALEEDEQRAQWVARLSRFEKDSRTVAAFCATEGVSTWSFYTWRKRLAAASGAERPRRAVATATAPTAPEAPEAVAGSFIDAGVARLVRAQRQAGLSPAGVEVQIELGGGVLLRVVRR